jgi:hypothetical protein
LLRLPRDLHNALTRAAAEHGESFNQWCVRRLRAPTVDEPALRSVLLDRAHTVAGSSFAGIVVLGSWARGEAAVGSDIDALIVIDPDLSLTRELYRTWDTVPVTCDGRAIDAHFVHPSGRGTPPTALWCEAAVDGLVWYDRDGTIAARLAEIRRAMAEGRVVRAVAHGQPYWKGPA